MAQLGADVDQLDALSQKFDTVAGEIQQMMSSLGTQIDGAWWQGGDADRFRSDWQGTYRPQLQNVCEALQNTARTVRDQAGQQRQTSQA